MNRRIIKEKNGLPLYLNYIESDRKLFFFKRMSQNIFKGVRGIKHNKNKVKQIIKAKT